MAAFKQIAFLLIFQLNSAQLDQIGEVVVGCAGADALFIFPVKTEERVTHVFYKSSGDDPQPLIDISGDQVIQTTRAACFFFPDDTLFGFQLKNLTLSDSGQYRAETWREGTLHLSYTFQLTVCQKRNLLEQVFVDSATHNSFDYNLTSFDLSQGDTVEIYRDTGYTRYVQIFPGGSPRGIEVINNSSTIHFSHIHYALGDHLILSRRDGQCLRMRRVDIHVPRDDSSSSSPQDQGPIPKIPEYTHEEHVASPGDTVTLLCPVEYIKKVEWQTPGKRLSYDPSLVITSLLSSGQEMYIDKQKYSLVIPSVLADHSGFYKCEAVYLEEFHSHTLSVCVVLEPMRVMFSQNDNATLVCVSRETYVLSTQWFAGSESENKILDSWGASADLPEELRGRVNTSDLKHSLTISSLSPEDNRVYRCLFKQLGSRCASRRFHLVHKHPFGADSTFYKVYSSLIGCGLMLVVVIIIVRSLRIRKGQQAPQLYEEVRMDRLPRQPDSVEEQNRHDGDV